MPPGKPVFLIAGISQSAGVEFGLLNGRMFEDGSTSVTVEAASSAGATLAGKLYELSVLLLHYAEGSLGEAAEAAGAAAPRRGTPSRSSI